MATRKRYTIPDVWVVIKGAKNLRHCVISADLNEWLWNYWNTPSAGLEYLLAYGYAKITKHHHGVRFYGGLSGSGAPKGGYQKSQVYRTVSVKELVALDRETYDALRSLMLVAQFREAGVTSP